jgi:hypothetical protein
MSLIGVHVWNCVAAAFIEALQVDPSSSATVAWFVGPWRQSKALSLRNDVGGSVSFNSRQHFDAHRLPALVRTYLLRLHLSISV